MTTYNHAYTLAFEALSEDATRASTEEIMDGLRRRVSELQAGGEAVIRQAVGAPFDTFDKDEDERDANESAD